LEDIEETLILNGLDNGTSLIGLLVLLLLLDLLLGGVFSLIPGDLSSFDFLNFFIIVILVDNLEFKGFVGEVFILVEMEGNS